MCLQRPSFLDIVSKAEIFTRCLSHCSPKELCVLLQTNKAMHAFISEYVARRWDAAPRLQKFVTNVGMLLDLLDLYGGIIGGSQVLQLLLETTYPSADLDIYIPFLHSDTLVLYLISEGYEVKERVSGTINNLIARKYPGLNGCASDVKSVCRLRRDTDGAAVDVVIPRHSVVSCILGTHSTCTANFMTARKVYCLYPRGTLLHSATVALRRPSSVEHAALEKYRARGFELYTVWSDSLSSIFPEGVRSTLDEHAWVFDLDTHGSIFHSAQQPYDPYNNSWSLVVHEDGEVRHHFARVTHHVLVPSIFGSAPFSNHT